MVDVAHALGIRVAPDLLDGGMRGSHRRCSRSTSPVPASARPQLAGRLAPALELRDTFHVYSDDGWTWLEEAEFADLDLATRRALLRGRPARVVWRVQETIAARATGDSLSAGT